MTAFYMTRLMSMTFHGEERFRKPASDHGHSDHADQGGGHHHGPVEPHESPRSMTVPLLVLAGCSLVAGWVGIPHALSFGANLNKFEHWLEPAIADMSREVPAAGAHAATAAGAAEHGAETGHATDPFEYVLMVLSVAIAGLGIWLGRRFYEKNPELPGQWAERLKPLYKLSFNKWYWDWLLDVKGVEAGKAANNALWKVDAAVVDGGVNGSAWLTRLWARISGLWDKWVIDMAVNLTGYISQAGSFVLRAIQTGFWQNYAMFFAVGLFLILIYYVYPALLATIRSFSAK
jgi:NADH-quinone oxidoreductase subunit L